MRIHHRVLRLSDTTLDHFAKSYDDKRGLPLAWRVSTTAQVTSFC